SISQCFHREGLKGPEFVQRVGRYSSGKRVCTKGNLSIVACGVLYTCLAHLDVSFVCKSELDLNALIQDVALTISVLSIVQNNI
ncbi:hypothetical protein, partial [Anaplasma phagocytophilum]|uniref:hypothetical protein n=1 Tax=Anaplasma phagocytophilum TaxID=948 RepID=UPI000CC836F4